MERHEDFGACLREGSELAASLIGIQRGAAVQVVLTRGYQPKVVPASAEGITADLDSRRIRLFVDGNDQVIRAFGA